MAVETETESWTSDGVIADTRRGLTDSPKWLSSLYFYDERGSQIFDAICQTPEYYPTRTELGILKAHANDILAAAGDDLLVAELGSGSSTKTRVLLDALLARQSPATYVPVDVSAEFLATIASRLEAEHPGLHVAPIAAEYLHGLEQIGAMTAERRLVLFLGSSLGNFEPEEQLGLLRRAHENLSAGDAFLLGTDLVKEPGLLDAAYNDAAGHTAAFNKNILAHLNRRLDGAANPDHFKHVAFYNEALHRIEMHLEATQDTRLVFPRAELDVPIQAGERIHTESSYKFTTDRVRDLAMEAGFTVEATWTDENDWFALTLLRA